MELCRKIEGVTRFGIIISNKPQTDKAEQASSAFRQMEESYNKNVEECKMFDFIIEMIADIAEIFVDLWVNKVINRKKKNNIDSGHISQQQVVQDGK